MYCVDENPINKTQSNFLLAGLFHLTLYLREKQVLTVNELKTYNNENTFLAQYLSNHCSQLERVFIVALILHLSLNC